LKKASIKEMIEAVAGNGPLLAAFLTTLLVVIRFFIVGPMAPYFFKYVAGDMKMMSVYKAFLYGGSITGTIVGPIVY